VMWQEALVNTAGSKSTVQCSFASKSTKLQSRPWLAGKPMQRTGLQKVDRARCIMLGQ